MSKIDAFFKVMCEQNASDMHLAVGTAPILRIDGTLRKVDYPPLTDPALRPMLYEILSEKQIEHVEKPKDLDFSYSAPDIARFRCNIFTKSSGLAASFRRIPLQISTLEEIGAPGVFQEVSACKGGLILVTGPSGCGKSTTLAALIHRINQTANLHIITLEDPLEFVHTPRGCVISQREIGTHCDDFASGLRSALREDPNVILIGEMPDLDTIQQAIRAAENGHLVLATLHAASAAKTVDRIIDVFPSDRQAQVRTMLAESLRAVISQQLLPRADGRGRVAAYEILIATQALRGLIREQKTALIPSMIAAGRREGMQTMDQALRELLQQGLITSATARQSADNPGLFVVKPLAVMAPQLVAA